MGNRSSQTGPAGALEAEALTSVRERPDDAPPSSPTRPQAPAWDTRGGRFALGLVPFLVLIGGWVVLSANRPNAWRFAVPEFAPTMTALHRDVFLTHAAWSGAVVTLEEAVVGLFIGLVLGVAVGTLIGLVGTAETILYPMIVFLQAIPKVALAPVLILVLGFGVSSKIALAASAAFFPILVNTWSGMHMIRQDEVDLLRSLGASSLQLFVKVRATRALASIFGGVQIAFMFALMAAIFGEFVGGTKGLGATISVRVANLDIAGAYAAAIELSIIGVVVTLALRAFQHRVSNWSES